MGETFLDRHGIKSGIKLNDVIEEFKYVYKGQEVKAGDFVNYINGVAGKTDYGESVDTQLSTGDYTGYAISAVQLDGNRVFIAHNAGTAYLLFGAVAIINGATITIGPDTQLSYELRSGYTISTCLLRNGNVFIAHSYGNTSYNLYGMVVTIDGTTITAGSDTALSSSGKAGYSISACILDNGNVFIAHSYGSSYYLYGIVVSISGTTITAGTDTALASTTNAGSAISTCLLPNGNVFIAHSYGSNYYLFGIVCSISGTTITAGNVTGINESISYSGYVISTCLLPNGNVFIAHNYVSSSGQLYGIVCTISGTTITKGTDTELGTSTGAGEKVTTATLNGGSIAGVTWVSYSVITMLFVGILLS